MRNRLVALLLALLGVAIAGTSVAYAWPSPNSGAASITGTWNVADFSPNGLCNSTYINQTIQAATASGAANADVFIPSATCTITSTIIVPANIHLRGAGPSTILQAATNLNTDIISSTANLVQISDLQINGNRSNQSGGNSSGIRVSAGSDMALVNVYAHDAQNQDIHISGTARVRVDGVTVSNAGQHGIDILGATDSRLTNVAALSNNQLAGANGDGVRVDGASNRTNVSNLTCSGSTQNYCLGESSGATNTFAVTVQSTGHISGTANLIGTGSQNDDNALTNSGVATLTSKTINCAAGGNVCQVNGNTLTATAGSATLTFPNSTDTMVGRATTDTLTNKTLTSPTLTTATLTSPTMTTPVVNSGGLQVTSGNVGIGAAPVSNIGLDTTSANVTASGAIGYLLGANGTLTAAANSDALYGLRVSPTIAAAGKTSLTWAGVQVTPPGSVSAVTNAYGVIVNAVNTSTTNNYGLFVNTPTGGTTNEAIHVSGGTTNIAAGGVVVGAATGGDPGNGLVNTSAGYKANNTLAISSTGIPQIPLIGPTFATSTTGMTQSTWTTGIALGTALTNGGVYNITGQIDVSATAADVLEMRLVDTTNSNVEICSVDLPARGTRYSGSLTCAYSGFAGTPTVAVQARDDTTANGIIQATANNGATNKATMIQAVRLQ